MLINIDVIFDHVACFVVGKRACKRVKSFAYGNISNMMCQYFIKKSSMRLERAHQNQWFGEGKNEILHTSEATFDQKTYF